MYETVGLWHAKGKKDPLGLYEKNRRNSLPLGFFLTAIYDLKTNAQLKQNKSIELLVIKYIS